MKTKSLISVLFLSVVLVACGPKDVKIQADVVKGITEASLPVAGVVEKGVVTLTGVVETDDQKAQVESIVKGIKGVKSIVNNVTVVPPISLDEALSTLVTNQFAAAGFPSLGINIVDQVLTLTGEVNKDDLVKILQIANESGAKQVINNLTILKK